VPLRACYYENFTFYLEIYDFYVWRTVLAIVSKSGLPHCVPCSMFMLAASIRPFDRYWSESESHHTWCGRKVMRLATLCTNWQCCCLPLQMAVRLTPAVDSVQVWTCYSCYAIVESFWVKLCLWSALRKWTSKSLSKVVPQILCKAWRIRYCDLLKVRKGL